jgi:hypothetical protein
MKTFIHFLFFSILFLPLLMTAQPKAIITDLNKGLVMPLSKGDYYYYGIKGNRKSVAGKLELVKDSSLVFSGKEINANELSWLSKKNYRSRPLLKKIARNYLYLYGISIVGTGIYYMGSNDIRPTAYTAAGGLVPALVAYIYLQSARPTYDFTEKHLLEIVPESVETTP